MSRRAEKLLDFILSVTASNLEAYTMSSWSYRKQTMSVAQTANSHGVKGPWSASTCAKACADTRSRGMKMVAESLGEAILLFLQSERAW